MHVHRSAAQTHLRLSSSCPLCSLLLVLLRLHDTEHACGDCGANELIHAVDKAVVEESTVDDLRRRDANRHRRVEGTTTHCTNRVPPGRNTGGDGQPKVLAQ